MPESPIPSQPLLSVLIPVYNEARTLRTIIRRVLASPVDLPMELVCVDDGSRDASPEILEALAAADSRIRVFRQPHNMGKGAAIIRAIREMRGDIGLIQDADLEYDPGDYPALVAPIVERKADAVFGSRFASAGQRKILLYWHGVANHFLTWLTNILNEDRKSTRLNSSHGSISYAVFCLKKKKKTTCAYHSQKEKHMHALEIS